MSSTQINDINMLAGFPPLIINSSQEIQFGYHQLIQRISEDILFEMQRNKHLYFLRAYIMAVPQ
jgi:hypothetical protein